MKTQLTLLLICAFGAIAQPDLRIVENNATYDGIAGIWGNPALPSSPPFPVNDGFLVNTEPRSAVPTNRVAEFAYKLEPSMVQRIMAIPIAVVNVGNERLTFGKAWSNPNYEVMTPPPGARGWMHGRPAVSNLLTITLTHEVQVVHEWHVGAIFLSDSQAALPGMVRGPFTPWEQGLSPGWAALPSEPFTTGAWVDTSEVEDGVYRMTIKLKGGNSTSRMVRIEALEVRVVGL